MIRSFKHAGLEKFFRTGSKVGIQPAHAAKLGLQLGVLNAAKTVANMNVNGWGLHPLKGVLEGHWSVKVNGNLSLTFRLEDGYAEVVDYH